MVVPDASVILKWVLPDPVDEDDLNSALALRAAVTSGKIIAKVPALWLYEVGNTLTRRYPQHATEALRLLIAFGLEEGVPDDRWLAQTIALTHDHGVTFHDAAYHASRWSAKASRYADRKYVHKAGKAGGVITLNEWAGSR